MLGEGNSHDTWLVSSYHHPAIKFQFCHLKKPSKSHKKAIYIDHLVTGSHVTRSRMIPDPATFTTQGSKAESCPRRCSGALQKRVGMGAAI